MSQVEELLKMLQSPDSSKRYDACEQLRVMEMIPPAATSALLVASEDSDPGVRERARAALEVHRPARSTPVEAVEVDPFAAQGRPMPAENVDRGLQSGTQTDVLLTRMLAHQEKQTGLLENISRAATIFMILVLLSVILGICLFLGGAIGMF